MRELNKGITGIQNKVVKCSVVTRTWHKGARFSDTQKLAILRETTAGECHSAGSSSASLKRRNLRVPPACRISVSHQLAIVSVLRQLAEFQSHCRWQGFSVAAARKFKFVCSRQGFRVTADGSFLVFQQLTEFQCLNSWQSFSVILRIRYAEFLCHCMSQCHCSWKGFSLTARGKFMCDCSSRVWQCLSVTVA